VPKLLPLNMATTLPKPTPTDPPVTLLQYICDRYLVHLRDESEFGVSYYEDCPACGSDDNFHTMPSKPWEKDRCWCWSCGPIGDEADLLKLLFPAEDYGQRYNRLVFLTQDWEQEVPHSLRPSGGDGAGPADSAFSPAESEESIEARASWPALVTEAATRLWQACVVFDYIEPGVLGDITVPVHPVLAWLRQRGLTDATIRAAGLGASDDPWVYRKLLIPWFDPHGGVRAIDARRFDCGRLRYQMKQHSRKGTAYPCWSDDDRPVMLCEGELDCLLARQELGDLVQAITFGGCGDLPQALVPLLGQRQVIVAFDADDAGDRGFEHVRGKLPQARRMRPTHGKDLTDTHAAVGLRKWFDGQAAL
jgi:hypothetical protein